MDFGPSFKLHFEYAKSSINVSLLGWMHAAFDIICKIGHYNPAVMIIDPSGMRNTYVVCVNFVHKLRDLQFKVHSERQIF